MKHMNDELKLKTKYQLLGLMNTLLILAHFHSYRPTDPSWEQPAVSAINRERYGSQVDDDKPSIGDVVAASASSGTVARPPAGGAAAALHGVDFRDHLSSTTRRGVVCLS